MIITLIRALFLILLTGAAWAEDGSTGLTRQSFARADRIVFPDNARYAPQIATLGKMLFFDPRLSGAQNMSCATCHNPSFGWETHAERAIGALNVPLARQAATLENLAEAEHLFWDGRASSLEQQAIGPITNPLEMNAPIAEVIERLSAVRGYRDWFETLYPGEGLTEQALLRSIATFERTLQSGWSPFDDWVEGNETAIPDTAKRGFSLFVGKGRCASCHKGWSFTDYTFHDIGLATDDLGRGKIVPDDPSMRFAFKTSGLRNIQLRAPYMHNGKLARLEDVLHHYESGGVDRPSKSTLIRPTVLSEQERGDLISFLTSLTAYSAQVAAPTLPAE
jgi:cytochrome c peroxidase